MWLVEALWVHTPGDSGVWTCKLVEVGKLPGGGHLVCAPAAAGDCDHLLVVLETLTPEPQGPLRTPDQLGMLLNRALVWCGEQASCMAGVRTNPQESHGPVPRVTLSIVDEVVRPGRLPQDGTPS